MRRTIPIVALMAVMLSGCQTTTGQRDISPALRTATYIGTAYALTERPELRGDFEQAVINLKVIEEAKQIDLASVLPIIQQFASGPTDSKYVILFTGALVLLSDYGATLPPEQMDRLRPAVKALREGIELGMGPKPASVRNAKLQ